MTKLLSLKRAYLCLSLLFYSFIFQSVFSQTSTGTQTFTAQGYDTDPVSISINTATDITVTQGQPIQSLKIIGFQLFDDWGDEWYAGWWCNEEYFSFNLTLDGTDVISAACIDPFINYDLTGATTVTVTSVDGDNSWDFLEMVLTLEVVYTTPSCPMPINLSTFGTNSFSTNVSWDTEGTETSWIVTWGEPGFTTPLGTLTATNTSALITGLSPNTNYQIKVVASCNSEESYPSSIAVQTACVAIPGLGFCENFEANSPTKNCWNIIDNNGDGAENWGSIVYTWTLEGYENDYYPIGNNESASAAAINVDYNEGNNDDYLITPALTLTGNEVLNFYIRNGSNFEPTDLEVLLSTNGNSPANFTEVLMPTRTFDNEEYELISINLSAYTGDVFIAFHVPTSENDGWFLFIDDVCIDVCRPIPAIPGTVDVCKSQGSVNLNEVVTTQYTTANWYSTEAQQLISGSLFNVSLAQAGTYEFTYVLVGNCVNDTTTATVNLFEQPNAGQDGTITACKNQFINLSSVLGSNYSTNGTWYAPNGTALTQSLLQAGLLPGQFVYKYIVNNGPCSPDTASVTVNITNCDYLGLAEIDGQSIDVYPNPATSQVTLKGLSQLENNEILLMDMQGKIIERLYTNNQSTVILPIENLENGVYFIQVNKEEETFTTKLIKK